jgi:hypothetical protein
MDSTLSPTPADPHHDDKVVLLVPKDLASAVEAVSKLAHDAARDASDRRTGMAGSELFGLPVTTTPVEATPRPAALGNDQVPSKRPSLGRRAVRTFGRFMLAACIGVGATLAWQSCGEAAKQMIASWVAQLGWLSSPLVTDPSSGREIAAKRPRPPAEQAATADAAPAQPASLAQTAPDTAPLTAPAGPSAELVQQQEMARYIASVRQRVEQLTANQEQMARDIAARDLATVRQNVEQLTASQEQMGRDIAKLQAAEQDIRRKMSPSPPRPAASARKRVPPPPPEGRVPRLSSVAPLPAFPSH